METEPILVKSKLSISTIFIIISVFLCIGVIIFIIIINKSKTPDCKNKCNNADDGVGGKCTKICDVGMKCVDKTCVCAPDCSDASKCDDDGCGGTCPCPTDSVCFDKKCCKPKCSNKCKGDSDDCGGTCDGPCTDIIARQVTQSSTCSPTPQGKYPGTVKFGAAYWPHNGFCGTDQTGGHGVQGYPANCNTGEEKIVHKDITYNGITINETIDKGESWHNYCYKTCPTGYESYSVEDKALFCKKK